MTRARLGVRSAQPAPSDATGPPSATDPHSARRSLTLRWVHPTGLAALDLSAAVIDIGRGPDNHVIAAQPSLSRHHARIERRGRANAIFDRASRNGLFVNGVQVQTASLSSGDVVRVGDLVGVVYYRDAGAAEEPRLLLGGLLGSSTLARALQLAERAANSALSILLLGETGTGKELVARAIHAASGRPGPLVALNCAAVGETLVEAQLFGHERGAFTGADRPRLGFIRAAHGGTLFLDEVGELAAAVQAKLLRVLEERAVTPVGGWSALPVDFRLIGATHRRLPVMARSGEFRADLFARMEGVLIELPALSERREDIPELFRWLTTKALGRSGPPLSARFVERICLHHWARNVRELRQAAERLVAFHGAEAQWRCRHLSDLGTTERDSAPQPERPNPPQARASLEAALAESRGNVAAAARRLGVSKMTVYRWLSEGGLSPASFRPPRPSRS